MPLILILIEVHSRLSKICKAKDVAIHAVRNVLFYFNPSSCIL